MWALVAIQCVCWGYKKKISSISLVCGKQTQCLIFCLMTGTLFSHNTSLWRTDKQQVHNNASLDTNLLQWCTIKTSHCSNFLLQHRYHNTILKQLQCQSINNTPQFCISRQLNNYKVQGQMQLRFTNTLWNFKTYSFKCQSNQAA